jgi:polyisoprenoid-binding protein YceI
MHPLQEKITILAQKEISIMKKTILFSGLLFGLLATSCGEQTIADNEEAKLKVKKIENCVYAFSAEKSTLDWTAYKFTRKAGVSGTFTQLQVEGQKNGAVPKDIIESLSFSIPTSTVETNNVDRNKKIDSLFFDGLEKTALITGKVVSLSDNGKATMMIKMNDIEKEVVGDYTLEDNKFSFKTEISVDDWNAQEQLKSLNIACKDLHTDVENGDTESKLWPDVSISFSTELIKQCD